MNDCGADTINRMLDLAKRLYAGETITSSFIRRIYGVSWATAKRDLVRLERALPVDVAIQVHHGNAGTAFYRETKVLNIMPRARA